MDEPELLSTIGVEENDYLRDGLICYCSLLLCCLRYLYTNNTAKTITTTITTAAMPIIIRIISWLASGVAFSH